MSVAQVAPEAAAELDDIWQYIAEASGNPDVARQIIASITRRFFLLGNNPYLGRRRDSDLGAGLRSFSVDNFVIIYRVEGDGVLILHVFHGSREIERLLE